MARNIDLALARIDSAISAIESGLHSSVKRIKGEHAAQGILYSGRTIVRVAEECEKAIHEATNVSEKELSWALDNLKYATRTDLDECIVEGARKLNEVSGMVQEKAKEIIFFCRAPRTEKEILPKLQRAQTKAITDLALSLEVRLREREVSRFKAFFSGGISWLLRMIGRGS